jgi:FAD/FMN-containing dehydrogenase
MKDMTYHADFHPKGCSKRNGAGTAIIAGAGVEIGEIQALASQHGQAVASGFYKSIGLVGWTIGGGHGPWGTLWGLGVDNVLEFELVTAAGDVVTANKCQNTDLFWAVRGVSVVAFHSGFLFLP